MTDRIEQPFEDLPVSVCDYLRTVCMGERHPAYFLVERNGLLSRWGGDCERYGWADLKANQPASEQVDFVEGLLPLGTDPFILPMASWDEGRYVDIHGVPSHEGDWFLVLDCTETAKAKQAIQQAMNDMALLRDKREALLRQVQKDHDDLQAMLNQLRVITAVLDAEGRIVFLSDRAESILMESPCRVLGRRWDEVFPVTGDDLSRLEAQITGQGKTGEKICLRMHVSTGRDVWVEIDVRDDPRVEGHRLLYCYDVSDVYNLRSIMEEKSEFRGMVGKSTAMEKVFQMIENLASLDATVLIEGETGTGKELVARAIHDASPNHDKPFIVVNCAGLSDSLINSELFGHRKGSFTGATQDQEGLFEAANGGTILLDEIGDVPMNTQTRLLRVLEQREVVRIGETQPRKITIRVLAATHKDLGEEARAGRFREDLLYRIRVARVTIPPLRQRREDIPLLTGTFLHRFTATSGRSVVEVDSEAMRVMMNYAWPGNVRELRNAVEFSVIGCGGSVLGVGDLPPEITEIPAPHSSDRPYDISEEKKRILEALRSCSGNRSKAADMLGISRATLYRRMKACFVVS